MEKKFKIMANTMINLNSLLDEKKFNEIKEEIIKVAENKEIYSELVMNIGFYQYMQSLLAKGGIDVIKFLLVDKRFAELDLKDSLSYDVEFLIESIKNRSIEAINFQFDYLDLNTKNMNTKFEAMEVSLHTLFKYIHDFSFFEQVFPVLDKKLDFSSNVISKFINEIVETNNYLIVEYIFDKYNLKGNVDVISDINRLYLKVVSRGQLEILDYLENNFTINLESMKENTVLASIFESGNISMIERAFSSKLFKKSVESFPFKPYIVTEIKNVDSLKVALVFLSKNPELMKKMDEDILMTSLITGKKENIVDFMLEKEIVLPSEAFIRSLNNDSNITKKLKNYLITKSYENLSNSLETKQKRKTKKL